ncbi:hypothetical protein JCM14469_34990 [Desulfatiferula olefinivorans]
MNDRCNRWGLLFFLSCLLLLSGGKKVFAYDGEDLGYIDAVTVNGRHFEDLDEHQIVFYPEDLVNGEVVIRGLLEQEKKTVPVDSLAVEVTFDGGRSWQKADGHASWTVRFRPELEREYAFAVRVVQAAPEKPAPAPGEELFRLAIGQFTLIARAELKDGRLSGTGVINLGFLNSYLPEDLKSQTHFDGYTVPVTSPSGKSTLDLGQGLPVSFTGLKLDKKKVSIIEGEIIKDVAFDLELLNRSVLNIRSLKLTPAGAGVSGRLTYSGDISLPAIPINNLGFTLSGIKDTLTYRPRRPVSIPLINGPYLTTLNLKHISLDVDTAAMAVALRDMDLSLSFGGSFGDVTSQAVSFLNGAYQWGSKVAGNPAATLTIPGTGITVQDIGGTIENGFSGLTLTGKLSIPSYDGNTLAIDLAKLTALKLDHGGISTLKPIAVRNLKQSFSLGGFEAGVNSLALEIRNNAVSGRLTGQMGLKHLANARLNVLADIGGRGLENIKADITDAKKTLSIPSFADLTLASAAIGYSARGGLSVSLDGDLTLTNPALSSLRKDLSGTAFQKDRDYYASLGKTTVSTAVGGLHGKADSAVKSAKGKASAALAKGKDAAATGADFVFRQLTISKDSIRLPDNLSGWRTLATPLTANLEALKLSADGWGIGTDAKGLWAGIKGSVSTSGTVASSGAASVKFYTDGSYNLLDFQANTTLTIGEFMLYTDVALSGGSVSGSGRIVSTFELPSLPAALKDSQGRLSLDVRFSDLEVNPSTLSVLAGSIEVPVAFTLPFDMADIQFSKLTFSPQSALADARVFLKGMPGIEGFALSNVALSSEGFGASVSYRPRNPLVYTFFDAPYTLTAVFKGLDLSFSTADMSFNITRLDAYLETGEAFDSNRFDLGVKDKLFAWGSAATHQAGEAVQQARLRIPGGLFFIENPGGYLSLQDAVSVDITGKIVIPGFDDFSITIPDATPLSISKSGISTQAEIVLDQLAQKMSFEGFPAALKTFSLTITKNIVEASFASDITLEKFGGIALGIQGVLGNQGIRRISLDSKLPSLKTAIDGFADIELKKLSAGYGEDGFYFTFDSDIRITNTAISGFTDAVGVTPGSLAGQAQNVIQNGRDTATTTVSQAGSQARKLVLENVSIYKDFITLPDAVKGWHDLTPAVSGSIQGVNLALEQWGAGTEGDRLWVGVKGSAGGSTGGGKTGASAEATVTAQFFTDGSVRVLDFDVAGVFTFGPFKLLTNASVSGGKLSGSGNLITETALSDEAIGYLPDMLIDPKTKTLNALVSFQNLAVSEAEKTISGGLIALEQHFTMSVDDILRMDIAKLGFSTEGISLDGVMDLPTIGSMVSVPNFNFKNLKLGLNGFSGISTLSTTWETPLHVPIIDNLGIALKLSSLGIAINWDKPGLEKVSFAGISGYLDFGTLFAETDALRNQAMRFVNNALAVDIPELTLPGTDLSLKSLTAKIDMSGSLPTISFDTASLNLPFYDEVLTIAGSGLKIDTSGLSGVFAMNTLNGAMALSSFGFNANLKSLSIEFSNSMISSGSFDLGLTVDSFFALAFDVSGRLSMDGISDIRLGMDASAIPTVNAYGIADISLNSLNIGYVEGSGVFLNLEPVIDITYDALGSLDAFTMDNVKVFKNRIETGGASISQSLDNMNFDLGPAQVALKRVGLSISDRDLEFSIGGNIKLADLCTAGADITLNKSGLSLEGIELAYQKPGINLGGLLEWSDGRFRSAVNMAVAEAFNFDGDITIGREKTDTTAFSYWRVDINFPAAIPLAPLPLSIYKAGGGLAYHMKAVTGEAASSPVSFRPDANTNFTFVANTQLGTTVDNGFSWHGDFKLLVDPSNFHILFKGDSYVMCTREESPANRKLSAQIELGASPMLFHLSAAAVLSEKRGSVELFSVAGMFDILFSQNDWHIHVGTKENKLSVSAINHIFSGSGYVMIDSSGLMLGVSKEFDVSDSIACFYGRLYGGASLDLMASVRPFFIDAEGKIWVGIEAGVKAFGEKFEIINAYGSLDMKIRCPDPTYVRVKAKFKYSFLDGWVSGTYKMTFWLPEKPEEAKSDRLSFPLISFLSPENNGSDISRITKFELNTSLPIDEVVRLDNGNKYVLRIVDSVEPGQSTFGPLKLYKYINIHDNANVYNALAVTDANGARLPRVVGGVLDVDTIKIQSFDQLKRNHTYTLKAQAHLIQLNDKARPGKIDFSSTDLKTVIARIEYEEPPIINTFRTADAADLATAREIIESVYPNYASSVIYPDTEVRVTYRVPAGGQALSLTNKHYVLDPLKRVAVSPSAWKQGLGTTDDIMATEQWVKFVKPQQPLNPVAVWIDRQTGEQREPVILNGTEVNPFTVTGSPLALNTTTGSGMVNANAGSLIQNTPGMAPSPTYTGTSGAALSGGGYHHLDERYERKELSSYYIQIKDPGDQDIVYQNKFEVTAQSGGGGNSTIIGTMAQDNSSEGNDPFNIVMIINSLYGEDTRAREDYEQRLAEFKDDLFARFMRREFIAGGPDCMAQGGDLPPESAHYYDEDSADHAHPQQTCVTGGCGYGGTCTHCYPAGYTYDYGYAPPPENSLPYFDEMLACPTFLREYELWLMNHPQPRDYSAFGAPEDIMFYFDTEQPLNWDALDMKFEIRFGEIYSYTNQRWLNIGTYTFNRGDYAILSQPESLNHIIRLPIASMMPADKAQQYIGFVNENGRGNDQSMGSATVSLWSVESYQAANGSISTRAATNLNTWEFTLKKGNTGEGYPCQSCQYYGYGASYCTDTICYTRTDPHFVLGNSHH